MVAEKQTIRIGTRLVQTAAFIQGISGTPVMGGAAVEVTSAGQLGIVMSSARYKRDIRDMGGKEDRRFAVPRWWSGGDSNRRSSLTFPSLGKVAQASPLHGHWAKRHA